MDLQSWVHCVQVHEPSQDIKPENQSKIGSSDKNLCDGNFGDSILARGKIKAIKLPVQRTQSSPSTNDSGFINDSYAMSSGVIPAESIEDDRRFSIEPSSQLSMSKASQCSCIEVKNQIKNKIRKNCKRLSFKKQKDVATLTDLDMFPKNVSMKGTISIEKEQIIVDNRAYQPSTGENEILWVSATFYSYKIIYSFNRISVIIIIS